jgi:NADH-quinone oxidoreductase subunit B
VDVSPDGAGARPATRGYLSSPESERSEILGEAVTLTRIDEVVSWGRKNSLWPIPFGTACCAIEFMGVVSSVYDVARFGAELVRFSPRQADLMIVAGTVTYKMAPILKRIYDQMCEPKWVFAMGVCASRCPPRPESVLQAILDLQAKLGRSKA